MISYKGYIKFFNNNLSSKKYLEKMRDWIFCFVYSL